MVAVGDIARRNRKAGPWLAAALLLGEFLWLAGHFTTATLPVDSDEPWVHWMLKAKALPQIGLAVITVLLLFRSFDKRERPPALPIAQRSFARLGALLAAQVGVFLLFVHLTAGIFEENLVGVSHPLLALACWALVALATVFLGVLFFLPQRAVMELLSRRGGVLTLGCTIGIVAWIAGQVVANELSLPLRIPTLWATHGLLTHFAQGFSADTAEFVIYTPDPNFSVRIAPECSGFEGMGLMAVFASTYVWVFRRRLRFPRLLILPVAGIVGMWCFNVGRLVALVWIGLHVSKDAAEHGFHSLAGTLGFCIAAFLVVLASHLAFFTAAGEREHAAGERDGTAAFLTPFLLSMAIGMIALALGESAGPLLLLKTIAPACLLWLCWGKYSIRLDWGGGVGLLLGAFGALVWVAIPWLEHASRDATAPEGPWMALRIASSVCVTPLVEELAFRGFLMRRLAAQEFEEVAPGQVPLHALAISSILFGILHEHWLAATLAGLLYGYAYMRRGKLVDCILAHACTNLLLVLLALYTGDWSKL